MLHPEYTNRYGFVFAPRTWGGGGHPGGSFAVQYIAWGD
jgi:arginase family enzyme